jgi:hypothetical protein
MLSDRPNEVIIKTTGGSLKDIDVYITNVQPIDTILLPTDDNGEVYLIQHYVIMIVSDLGQVSGFL